MFLIKPVDDREQLKKLYDEKGLAFDGRCFGVRSEENGELAGYCFFTVDDYTVEIIYLEYPENDDLMGDTLLRAALNYAGNRNAYNAVCSKIEYSELLKGLGFVENDNVFTSTIPEIFATCKNCGGPQK